MLGLPTLDVVIGLVFIYVMLSLVVTTINEFIAQAFNLRGRTLFTGIRALIDGDAGAPGSAAAAATPAGTVGKGVNVEGFYAHPLVKGLRADSRHLFSSKRLLPSYVPPRTFVLTLLDLIIPAHTGPNSVEAIRARALTLPDQLKLPLLVLINDAEGDLSKFQVGVERWFNDAMERVSGYYKRRSQWITFCVAAAVTIVANADSSRIWHALSTSPALRTALVAQATALVQQSDTATARTNTASAGAANAAAAKAAAAKVDSTKTDSPGTDATQSTTQSRPLSTDSIRRAYATIDSLAKLGVPLGWPPMADRVNEAWTATLWRTFRQRFEDGIFRLPGLFLTAIAISLGAPFWFDVLNKFVNIRAAGRAPEEKPKSPEAKPAARGA